MNNEQWTINAITALAGCLVIVLGFALYLKYLAHEAVIAKETVRTMQAVVKQLDALETEILQCEWQDELHPCIRVMEAWGAYGENQDIFIIRSE